MKFREERIGGQRLILGDCLEVMPTLGPVDAVVTSPPYGQQRDYGKKINDWRALVSGALLRTPAHETTQILCNLGLIHREGFVVRYWDEMIEDMEADGWRLFGWYVWDQLHGQTGDWNGRLAPAFEFIFHFNRYPRKPNKTKPTLGGKHKGGNIRGKDGSSKKKASDGKEYHKFKIPDSIIRCGRENSPFYSRHPARFPVRFAHELIEPYSEIGETILDPFMGSGTTLAACQKLGRHGIGIELDPDYFEIACRRVEEAARQPDLLIPETRAAPMQEKLL